MSKVKRASEDALAELHTQVAVVLTSMVTHEVQETEISEDGEITPTGETRFDASPATISAAVKFLKDNSITCEIETSKNMGNLRDVLSKKQKHSREFKDPKVAARSIGE